MTNPEMMGMNRADQIRNGMMSDNELSMWRQEQKRNTGTVLQHEGVEKGGLVVDFQKGRQSFANLGELVQYCKENLAVVNNPDGSRLAGNTIDELRSQSRPK